MSFKSCVVWSVAGSLVFAAQASANLIVNGDFEAGNSGFSSALTYMPASLPPHVNQYGVVNNSFEWTNFWNTVQGDHTTGTGKFLIADVGSTSTIWQQTVAVDANSSFTLSAWLATWTTFAPATLGVEINGVLVGTWGAPGTAGPWAQHTLNWNSGAATSATIRFFATTVFQPGDDVAIDDISLVPAPGALALLALSGALRGRRR